MRMMARQKGIRLRDQGQQIPIHEDVQEPVDHASDIDVTDETEPRDDDDGSEPDDESEDEEIDESVAEEISRFESTFKGMSGRYRLINRIGEGTFSTVYKAEDLHYHEYRNDWDQETKENSLWQNKPSKKSSQSPRYVAIKKIYVTSSPIRIFNELELLHDLRGSDSVCPLITAYRHQDQVVAVLPYFKHHDFREYYRDMKVSDMRPYFRSLFTALQAVHARGILHRDIKPTNFLYNPEHARGVLVDFGLAERQGTDWKFCHCELDPWARRSDIEKSAYAQHLGTDLRDSPSYPHPDRDKRPSRRANRAGTRGFRAPEVLLKCTAQRVAIDVWSVGVMLLSLLTRRFPFFHSADDVDALLEMTHIFGRRRMRETALLHGQVLETNIPSYSENGHSLEKILLWATNRTARDDHGQRLYQLSSDEKEAVGFLERCLECDPSKRITAEEALKHPFIASAGVALESDDAVELL